VLVAGVIFYLLLTLMIGVWAARRVKNERDFALAGKNLPFFMATSTVFATWFGSETILASSANFVRDGFYGVIEEPFGAALCLIIVGAVFARKLYAMNLTTFSDFYRVRFGVTAEVVSSVLLSFSYISWVAAQFLALGIVFHTITGLSLEMSVVIMAALVALYTTLGGMWAVSMTDTLQMTIIVLGLTAVLFILSNQAGGFSSVLAKAPPTHFSLLPPGKINWLHYISLWCVLGLGSVPGQDVFQRIMASRSASVAATSSIVAGFLYLTIAMIPLFLGLIAVVLLAPGELPKDMQFLLPQLILSKTPVWVQIMFFGALVSAILSTASGALLAPSVLVSENLLRKIVRDPKKTLLLARVSTVLIALWALQMALAHRHIHGLVTDSSSISLVALLVPFLVGFWHKESPSAIAVISMLSGFTSWKLWESFAKTWGFSTELYPAVMVGLAASAIPYAFYFSYVLTLKKIYYNSRSEL
jgi:SSS family solute:Na+ symporter